MLPAAMRCCTEHSISSKCILTPRLGYQLEDSVGLAWSLGSTDDTAGSRHAEDTAT